MMAQPRKRTRPSPDHHEILLQITGSLTDPRSRGVARLIQNRIGTTDQFNIVIITNLWRKVPREKRTGIALAVAEELKSRPDKIGDLARGHVYTASALTFDEAISLGYFPYRIEPATEGLDEATRAKVERAFRREGPVETVDGPQLRYPTRESARDAYRRLSEEVPGPHWVLCEEVMVEA